MTRRRTKLARQVEERAHGRCEYCRMFEAMQGTTFHLEHTIPSSHSGPKTADNLAWACPHCNLCKGTRQSAIDPDSSQTVPLFNPRVDAWEEHFFWHGHELVGKSATGRATIAALNLNHPRRIFIRQAEGSIGEFPPPTD